MRDIQKFITAAVMVFCVAGAAHAQQSQLGSVNFPVTTQSAAAREHFNRGLAAFYSFWFEEAVEEFQASTKADPKFAMGYWGEAMAHNHPLWAEQDTAAARTALEKIGDTRGLTERERAYIDAVRALYGDGEKLQRDRAYAAAMEKVYRQYPDDLEAATLYSLALLGTMRPGDKGYRTQAQAGAVAMEVFQKNPSHPGAAHFIIHSFDDPEHAILALPAARRYAGIAPEAHHARHMPSHIFIQLGMWPEAAASNESAWDSSVKWVERKKLSPGQRDLHSLHWWTYIALQQGKWAEAERLFEIRNRTYAEAGGSDNAMRSRSAGRYFGWMAAELVIEKEDWARAAKLFPEETTQASAPADGAHVHGPAAASSSGPSMDQIYAAFGRGFAAAKTGNAAAAEKEAARLAAFTREMSASNPYRARYTEILELEVRAQVHASKREFDKAIEAARKATVAEEEMSPPSGPPDLVKPSHELFGEVLMAAGKHSEAMAQFRTSLLRQPNRARSLLGAARAASKAGDATAAGEYYAKLLEIWKGADAQLAELREAREFVRQARASR